jgi:hypothetical protein
MPFIIQRTDEDIKKAKINPIRGAMKMNDIILMTPENITDFKPFPAIAAPINPPTRVWDELEGKPHHQVSKFQIIAAINAPPRTFRLIIEGSTTPLPIVCATFIGKTRKETNLKAAAIKTAAMGLKACVETTVAIELAES